MKVALVHDYLREYGGAERVLEVLREIYPESTVYSAYYLENNLPDKFKDWEIKTSFLQKMPLVSRFPKIYTYLLPYAFELFDLREYDLIISSSTSFAKGVISHPRQKHICYCHTPARFLWGMNGEIKRNKILKLLLWPFDSYLRTWDYTSAQRVDQFIANSVNVQKRIKAFWGRDAVVINPPIEIAVDFTDLLKKKVKDEYYLVVSRLEKFKNVELIVNVFNDIGLKLKVVGKGSQSEYLKSIAKNNIKFLNYVSDKDLANLYLNAKGLVVAAEDEDFGMTVVEANSYGVSVIAYRGGGYLETVKEGLNGTFFDNLNTDSLKKALSKFEVTIFDQMKIRSSADEFSVEEFKKKFLNISNTI